jgi:hypothetical protein
MPQYRQRPEHRMIMERELGRPLTSNEVVHHINGNGLDNRIENLRVMTKKGHCKLHGGAKRRPDPLEGRLLLRFPEGLANKIRELAVSERRTIQDQVRHLVELGIERNSGKSLSRKSA